MRLTGARVALRPERVEDAGTLARAFAEDPTLGTMMGMEAGEETEEWLRRSIAGAGAGDGEPQEYWFAIIRLETDELLGEIGLVDLVRTARRGGLSILVLPAARRTGVAREAIELLVRWAQGELGLRRIEIRTLPENLAVQALAEASGFAREGVLRAYGYERGRFVDNVVYSRLPE